MHTELGFQHKDSSTDIGLKLRNRKEQGKEVCLDIRAAYIDTMSKAIETIFHICTHVSVWHVLNANIRAYIQALEKLQFDTATSNDLIGIDTRSNALFLRGREPLKNRYAVFALGERINIILKASSFRYQMHLEAMNEGECMQVNVMAQITG